MDGYALATRGAGRGDGVVATRSFRPRQTVMVGVIEERRVPQNHSHASQVGRSEYVELGGLASKVNHSSDLNCGVQVNQSGAYDLVARRSIWPGDEITFDYAMRNYSVEHFPSRCRCGAPSCRGVVTGWKDLSAEQKAVYTGLVAPYLLAIDHGIERDALRSCHAIPWRRPGR